MTDPFLVSIGAHERTAALSPLAKHEHQVALSGAEAPLQASVLADGATRVVSVDGRIVTLLPLGEGRWFEPRSRTLVRVERARARAPENLARPAAGPTALRAPMPGRIVRVLAAVGTELKAGAGLVVIEAMKMENELAAPRAGTVLRIAVQAGDAVDRDALLVEIE
jgi:biotin carboxyl carrier protein